MSIADPPNPLELLRHFRTEGRPFAVRRGGGGPVWEDGGAHASAYERDAELYALCAVAERVQPGQRARVLFQLLAPSRAGLDAGMRATLDRVAAWLVRSLPAEAVLSVFLALRRVRANHKHARRVILDYLLNHPQAERLAMGRRQAVVDCLEHALGRNVVRACAKVLEKVAPAERERAYLRRHLLRFALDGTRAARLVRYLYRQVDVLPASAGEAPTVEGGEVEGAVPKTVTATNRGAIAAALVHLYRGGTSLELERAVVAAVDEAAAVMPAFDGTVALVLDASASAGGYGEREFACLSQAQALRLVLARRCASLRVYAVGGSGEPPRPQGATDLALAVLDALAEGPDVVVVVSDGYENTLGGELARVRATLPRIGVRTPVVFVHSQFTAKDDLSLRRPVRGVEELVLWHQEGFAEMAWGVFASAGGGKGEAFLRRQLRERLGALELA